MAESKVSQYIESAWRHRQLSDENIRYFLDKSNGTIHDKRCKNLRNISDESIVCLQNYDFRCNQCRKCAMDAYIHFGAKDPENYQEYKRYFASIRTSIENLRFLYVEKRMTTKLELNSLKIWCKEDVWIIQSLDKQGNIQLKHNNYYKQSDGSRRYAPGFHIQNDKCRKCRIKYALDIISQYNYQDHFIKDEDIKENTQNPVATDNESETKAGFLKNIFSRFGRYINLLLKHVDNPHKRTYNKITQRVI